MWNSTTHKKLALLCEIFALTIVVSQTLLELTTEPQREMQADKKFANDSP